MFLTHVARPFFMLLMLKSMTALCILHLDKPINERHKRRIIPRSNTDLIIFPIQYTVYTQHDTVRQDLFTLYNVLYNRADRVFTFWHY